MDERFKKKEFLCGIKLLKKNHPGKGTGLDLLPSKKKKKLNHFLHVNIKST